MFFSLRYNYIMNNKFKTFPNSNFKVDTFFRKPEYRSRINAAASTGDKRY